ncbi:peptidoglycan amidohydrolase family protein [Acinetobacter sp. YH12085]|uniref:peptidoglycan amidohydrolase family protein n=1 Tax=Acinetobacter sp. YH12085 TaxID=2601077 RepID=UPI0015D20726|nr:peptidoglycan amidohydrolase family protein [Acinetobacter sp. YH12085]
MAYDHNVNLSEVHAPVQANIIIRSQASKNTGKSNTTKKAATKNVVSRNGQRIDIDRLTGFLQGITRQSSTQKCARSVRLALESAGARFNGHPVAAADWGSTLQKIGYQKINLAFDRPKKGDIYIIDRNQSSRYGHIAAYSGKDWVSDYRQAGYAVYRTPNVKYSYYRLAD